ncbi:MAG: AAA family ATPase [Prevotella sp.]|jgi:archaellum biogenesis ATPase FlaH|nr:AAA family ATPase [Prevotella sp.]MCI1281110.1 AAA family ATPase [Prevotella sp.]
MAKRKIKELLQADLEKAQPQEQKSDFISAKVLYERDVENIPTLVEPILPKSGIVCIAGASDTGKSAFLRFLALSIVSESKSFLGMAINAEYHKAIYVSTEDDETAICYLIRRQAKDMNINTELLGNMKFLFNVTDLTKKLDEQLESEPVDVVFIDCFSDLYGGEMNQNNKVRTFLNEFEQLANKYQCLFFFLHHCGKRTEELAPSKNNLIGSQGLEAKMRLVMELRSDLQNPDIKHLCIVKGNYLPAQYKYESYDLRFSENMCFSDTGNRTPFEALAKVDDTTGEKYERIMQMKRQGKTYEQIGSEIGCTKGNVSKIIRRVERSLLVPKPLDGGNGNTETDSNVSNVFLKETEGNNKGNDEEVLPF